MEKLFIPLLLGTRRKGRESEKVAKFLFEKVKSHPEIETLLIDARDLNFPNDDEGQGIKDLNPQYKDAIIRCDGIIIVSPEYNHAFPGTLKLMLDICLKEYIHKAVALCGVSSGGFGGARMIEHLVQVVRELGLAVTFTDLHFPVVSNLFDEKGAIKETQKYDSKIKEFLEELIWMAKVLRWGRQNVPSKHHSK